MTQAWLDRLTQREIVWLMLQLRPLAQPGAWANPETARQRIQTLRVELLDRRCQPLAPH